MCLHVKWDNPEHTIIQHSVEAIHWTVDDLRLAFLETWEMMQTVDHTVGVIFDVRGGHDVPAGFLALSRWVAMHRPANAGWIVIVGGSPRMQAMYDVFRCTYTIFNHDFKLLFVDTLPEARHIFVDQPVVNI